MPFLSGSRDSLLSTIHYQQVVSSVPIRFIRSHKVVFIAISASVAIAALARYLRRRRRALPPSVSRRPNPNIKRGRGIRSPNGELSQCGSPGRPLARQSSVFSGLGFGDRVSVASGSSVGDSAIPGAHLTPQQLGVMVATQ